MKKYLATALLAVCVLLHSGNLKADNAFVQRDNFEMAEQELPLFRSARLFEQNRCKKVEQEFITNVGKKLITISEDDNSYVQVRDCLLLIQDIVSHHSLSKKVRLALFEVVEDQIRALVRADEESAKRAIHRALSVDQSRCSTNAGDGGVNFNVEGAVSPEEIQEILAGVKNSIRTAQSAGRYITYGKAAIIAFMVSAIVGLSVLAVSSKLGSGKKKDQEEQLRRQLELLHSQNNGYQQYRLGAPLELRPIEHGTPPDNFVPSQNNSGVDGVSQYMTQPSGYPQVVATS